MRILHTSDWHLGRRFETHPRDEEHRRFLDWLLDAIDEHDVDALLVAGDVYQNDVPPAAAESLYFDFLSKFAARFPERHIVIIAGNHDSGARLEAPAPVLKALQIHVKGTWESLDDPTLYHVLPRRDGTPGAVVAAIPFVHDMRLFRTPVDTLADDYRERRNSEFRTLYRDAAARARTLHPGLPVIAMGHLATGEARDDDYETGLHRIGTLGALPKDLTDDADYAALGHIHRCFPVGKAGWYSGSPIPLRINELSTRYVLLADVHADRPADVRKLDVPRFREVLRVGPAPLDEVRRILGTLQPHGDLDTWVTCDVVDPTPIPDLATQLTHALTAGGIQIVAVRQALRADVIASSATEDARDVRSLHEVTPTEIFTQVWQARYGEPPDPRVRAAFDELLLETAGHDGGAA